MLLEFSAIFLMSFHIGRYENCLDVVVRESILLHAYYVVPCIFLYERACAVQKECGLDISGAHTKKYCHLSGESIRRLTVKNKRECQHTQ